MANMQLKDMTGQVFGELRVIEREHVGAAICDVAVRVQLRGG